MQITRPGPEPIAATSLHRAPARRVAALVAFVLGITSFVAGVSPIGTAGAQTAPWNAAIQVSKTTGIDPAGETITVTGTGFDPAAHVGTRPPLANQPSGVYVTFGRFGDPWKPSEGAASANRQILSQRWALPAEQKAILDPNGTNEEVILLNPDGTFTANLPVAEGGTGTNPYAIAVYAASGAVDPSQELLTPISFGTAWNAAIQVSKTTGIDPAGETITVTGTGFNPAAHVGTRPPLANQPSGVYVTFGRFGDPWKPSEGAASANRQILSQRWALPAEQKAILDPNGTNEEVILLNPDGTFTANLPVAEGGTGTNPYAIAVYAASGAVDPSQELLTPISFGTAPTWDPQVTVSNTTDLDEAGETITVNGTGFDPAANAGTHPPIIGQPSGIYVAFGRYADQWKPSEAAPPESREGLSVLWVVPPATRAILDPSGTLDGFATLEADGTFSVDLDAAPGGTTTGGYAVVTYAGGGAVNAAQETRTDITFAVTPPPAEPGTGHGKHGQVITVTPYKDLVADGQDIVVEGTGFDPAVGVYVALCADQGPNLPPSPCIGGSGEESGSSSSAWITDNEQFASLRTAPWGPGGSFAVTIHINAADEFMDCYDVSTTCVVATRADHTATANRSADVKVPVFFEGQTPVDPDPDPTPTAAALDKTTVVAGEDLTVTGEGFIAGEQVQVWLHSEPQLMGVTVADSLGKVTYTFTVPATTETGTHHVELYGITSALRLVSPSFSVVAAAVPAAAAATPPASSAPTTTTTTATSGTLPVTGAGLVLPIVGIALLALGAVLASPGRRRGRAVPAGAVATTSTSPNDWEQRA